MIKAVIFDMDGVIIDSEHLAMERNKVLFKELNIDVPDSFQDKLPGTTCYSKWSMLKAEFGLTQRVEDLVKLDRDRGYQYFKTEVDSLKPIPGVYELIQKLYQNNIRLAIASSSQLKMVHLIVHSFKIDRFFDILASGDDINKGKPDPEIFILTAKKLGVPCENCLVIEDSTSGVEAAKKAGMKCIGYINEHSGNQDLSSADITIDDFKNIPWDYIVCDDK